MPQWGTLASIGLIFSYRLSVIVGTNIVRIDNGLTGGIKAKQNKASAKRGERKARQKAKQIKAKQNKRKQNKRT